MDLVTYTEKILKGKLYFLCSAILPTLTGISGRTGIFCRTGFYTITASVMKELRENYIFYAVLLFRL